MVEVQAPQGFSFTTIQYVTKDGEKCTATKNNGVVTVQGDKNGVRQIPLNDFIKELATTLPKVDLEKTPNKDTVSFGGEENKKESAKKSEVNQEVKTEKEADDKLTNKYLGIGGGVLVVSSVVTFFAGKGKWWMKGAKQLETKGQELLSDAATHIKGKAGEAAERLSGTTEHAIPQAVETPKAISPKPETKNVEVPKPETSVHETQKAELTELEPKQIIIDEQLKSAEESVAVVENNTSSSLTKVETKEEPVQGNILSDVAKENEVVAAETTAEKVEKPVEEIVEKDDINVAEEAVQITEQTKPELDETLEIKETVSLEPEIKTDEQPIALSRSQASVKVSEEGLTMPVDIEMDIAKILRDTPPKDILDKGGRFKYVTIRDENGKKIREYTIDTVDPQTNKTRLILSEVKDYKPGESVQFRTVTFNDSGEPNCVTDKIGRFRLLSDAEKKEFMSAANSSPHIEVQTHTISKTNTNERQAEIRPIMSQKGYDEWDDIMLDENGEYLPHMTHHRRLSVQQNAGYAANRLRTLHIEDIAG